MVAFRLLFSDLTELPSCDYRAARYPSVTLLTLYFNQNAGAETSQIYFLGFKGEFTKRSERPGVFIYEAQANPADHAKLPGMESGMHSQIG
jgi:hypothetical protein